MRAQPSTLTLAICLTTCLAICLTTIAVAAPLNVETTTLPNGLTVILHEDHTQPMVTINTWFHVGSKDESPGRTGFAHLFEHLMFMGTDRVPDNQFDVLMERGGGANNASTSTDRTNYYSWGPRSLLPTLMWLDADRLDGLSKAMTTEKVELQVSVVRNERRQGVDNQPYGKAGLIIAEALYPAGHPYAHSVIGSHEDLAAATADDVKEFFDTYYVPGNATLVVAGDFDRDDALQMVNDTFGAVAAKPLPRHLTAEPVLLEREVRRLATDRVSYGRLYLVWHSPAGYRDGDADMDVAAALLADGDTGRLVERLVRQDQLAQDVSVYQYSKELGSEFHIEATAAEGADLERIKQVILEEVALLQSEGPSEDELARVQAATESGFLRQKESLRRRANKLNAYRKAFGEADSFDRDLARRLAPTTASVQAWSRQVLGEGRLDLRILPEGEANEQANLDIRPENLPERPSEPAVAEVLKLKNGRPLYVVSRPGSGLFSGAVIVDGGKRIMSADKSGLASLCATMITKGAGKRGASDFADAVAALGGQVRAGSGNYATSVQVSGLTSRLDDTLALWADALMRPTLSEEDFAREKDLAMAGINSRAQNANRLARVVSSQAVFGRDDPRGRPNDGFLDTVESLKLDDVKQWAPRLITPSRAAYVFVGDFTPDQIKKALDRHLGKWKNKDKTQIPDLPPVTAAKPGILLVDRPDAAQTVINLARPIPAPDQTGRVARDCLNTLFGGSFTSRLMQNIREEHGYSYGARSAYYQDGSQWMLAAGSSVQTEVTGAALNEFRKEFTGLSGGDVTPDELEKAVRTVRFDLENAGATTGAMAGLVAELVRTDRPMDALRQDLGVVPRIDLGGINNEAKSGLYNWDDLMIVLVGDKDTVLPQLEEAGFPAPQIVDQEGRPAS
jgi:zinc protease